MNTVQYESLRAELVKIADANSNAYGHAYAILNMRMNGLRIRDTALIERNVYTILRACDALSKTLANIEEREAESED
jgi:hypothetical protein